MHEVMLASRHTPHAINVVYNYVNLKKTNRLQLTV